MLLDLPRQLCPIWLKCLNANSINKIEFPLTEILTGSLYYPSSHFDGDPVRHLAGNIHSFIYVDYGYSEKELDHNLETSGFTGYTILGRRSVSQAELNPKKLTPSGANMEIDGNTEIHSRFIKKPFCEWLVFERNRDLDSRHGPERFSLIYLCADGAAAYQILFTANGLKPSVICIIQPGDAFGRNWTNFKDPNQILARSVQQNSAGIPPYLLDGQNWKRDRSDPACWPYYDQFIGLLHKANGGNISVFGNSGKND